MVKEVRKWQNPEATFISEKTGDMKEEFFWERNRDDKKEQMLLKKEAEKCYNLLMRKTADPRKKEEAFWRRLLTKGFRSEDIRSVIEERRYTFK